MGLSGSNFPFNQSIDSSLVFADGLPYIDTSTAIAPWQAVVSLRDVAAMLNQTCQKSKRAEAQTRALKRFGTLEPLETSPHGMGMDYDSVWLTMTQYDSLWRSFQLKLDARSRWSLEAFRSSAPNLEETMDAVCASFSERPPGWPSSAMDAGTINLAWSTAASTSKMICASWGDPADLVTC